ncbi:uncharacterized protein LOC115744809 isoform X2 [Rhodamnia argentea]|nr:uncharacterized protein LOC115744809 isoform X2 [Rhodamnia argentea]
MVSCPSPYTLKSVSTGVSSSERIIPRQIVKWDRNIVWCCSGCSSCMGGLSHVFDQRSMARKVFSQKKHVGGHEAPRNSLELQAEASESCCAIGDMPYSYRMEQDRYKMKRHPVEASMKKLISEEISSRSFNRQNSPSIVARLMGMDILPLDNNSQPHSTERKQESMKTNFSRKERKGRGTMSHSSSNSSSSRHVELSSSSHNPDRNVDRGRSAQESTKPRRREHPQEEELQKFKKEFEAWQANRFREFTKFVELDNVPRQSAGGQERCNLKMIPLHANHEKTVVEKTRRDTAKAKSIESDHSLHSGKTGLAPAKQYQSCSLMSKSLNKDIEQCSAVISGEKLDSYLGPTRIVILKPGPDRFWHEESWPSSSGADERGSIEDFLQEVKERLKSELQGRAVQRSSVVRGSGIETPFNERPTDSKQIAQNIAKQVRESVTRDLGVNLLRSESTRSYRSEIQLNPPCSPEFINRDTRKFLTERLRNVLKSDSLLDLPREASDSSSSSLLGDERSSVKHVGNALRMVNEPCYWENVKDERQMQARSFRHGLDDDCVLHKELSPRNLVRSLSAPVSGTSFGKLLLEDRHILTGAHIRRKHEVVENVPIDAKKVKKEKLKFKERVHNFRYTFTLRRRLFGKRAQSVSESYNFETDFMKDVMSGPTVVMNFGEWHENSTEVPPSPASVCSGSQEEFWRPSNDLSPMSTPDRSVGEEDVVPQAFREISLNLNELRRQLNQLGSDEPLETTTEEQPIECKMVELEDKMEQYIRDLLVASGLYDGSSNLNISRMDTLAKPISDLVFQEVEESHGRANENGASVIDKNEKGTEHKLLHDLLNEALSTVLGQSRRKTAGSFRVLHPQGRELLSSVWEIIRVFVYPPIERSYYSLDNMTAWDLKSIPWLGLLDDEINLLGKEVESLIIGDLVEEIVKDM